VHGLALHGKPTGISAASTGGLFDCMGRSNALALNCMYRRHPTAYNRMNFEGENYRHILNFLINYVWSDYGRPME